MPEDTNNANQEEPPRTPKERLEKAIILGAADVKKECNLYEMVLDGILQDIQMLPQNLRDDYKRRLSAAGYEINGSNNKNKKG